MVKFFLIVFHVTIINVKYKGGWTQEGDINILWSSTINDFDIKERKKRMSLGLDEMDKIMKDFQKGIWMTAARQTVRHHQIVYLCLSAGY